MTATNAKERLSSGGIEMSLEEIFARMNKQTQGACLGCGKHGLYSPVARFCSVECVNVYEDKQRASQAIVERRERGMVWKTFAYAGRIFDDTAEIGSIPIRQTNCIIEVDTNFHPSTGLQCSIVFRGPQGRGKSFAARYALWRSFVEAGKLTFEVSARRLLRDGDRIDGWRLLCKSDVVLIDDLDKAVWNEQACATFWEVADVISRRRGRFLLTTNTPINELAKSVKNNGGPMCDLSPAIDRMLPMIGVEAEGDNLRRDALKVL